ncbi:MAG TPA: ATP-binding cassette domain-containing protein [Symbiobacteriaceae bacterium]|nr:ATP-binding cassette domain-containing protein [Symbiobacteriaceae bacterium]
MRKVIIQARRLTRVYGSDKGAVHALRDVDLTLMAGDYAVVLGPAGAGKSTLLRVLGFRERATGGDLFYMGGLVTSLTDLEMAKLRESETGFVEGAVGGNPSGRPCDARHSGDGVKATIGRVLAHHPPLLLADEPLWGLAGPESLAVLTLLHRLNGAGQTILLTTEDPEVAAFGRSLYRMCNGVIRPIRREFRP